MKAGRYEGQNMCACIGGIYHNDYSVVIPLKQDMFPFTFSRHPPQDIAFRPVLGSCLAGRLGHTVQPP